MQPLAERRDYQRRERELIAMDPELAAAIADEPTCHECGCSESIACPGGCGWAQPGLCTACAEEIDVYANTSRGEGP